ncbi:MAG: tartrate dehydrogenase [Clostridia bacterium]|nr:tartrate dehydrogenase [Clostridia bacterium]
MKNYNIAVIPGDGIGPEVIAEGIKVLNCISEIDGGFGFTYENYPWGCEYYLETGKMMPDDGLELLKKSDAILLGAVGFPGVPDHISLRQLLLVIRHEFDQYVNLRPVKLLRGAKGILANAKREDIDMVFVRENSEGEYSGQGEWVDADTPGEYVVQKGVFTRKGCERIMRYAFELAREKKTSVTSISKGNALNYSMVFWDKIFAEISKEYPDVPTQSYLVDAASMLMVTHPEKFGVVVASNLFGDILTDLGAAIAGGIGLAAGANINPEGTFPSMFEPIHGSAPDIAGRQISNPLATVWAVSQLLDHFGYTEWGKRVLDAIEELLVNGSPLTPDMGGNGTTAQVGGAICDILRENYAKKTPGSILIKDTTRAQRAAIVAESIGNIEASCDGCMPGLAEMYQDYIDGIKELRQINMEFNARYVRGMEGPDRGGCVMN